MPSKYLYTKRGKTQNYQPSALEQAVNAVKDGSMSIRESSAHFHVPRSTIGDRISGKHAMHVPNGRPPHIPREVEDKIVSAVKMAARRGVGLTRKQILTRTNVLCQRMKIGSGYNTFRAGKDWWEGLKRRHPDIALRRPEKLTTTRARMMNREVMGRYFQDLGTIIDGLHLEEKPFAIWNCDEMSKNFEHTPSRVVAAKGEECLSRTSPKSTNITVMACVNAAGRRMPPMFIVKGKTKKSLYGFNTEAAPTGSRWFWQRNGWMDDFIGEKWFDEVFLRFCGPTRPQLLILDGHSSHETLAILMRAMEENIHILALPPHTTHYAQPLDRAIFGPLNKNYNEACSEFLHDNPLNQINKWTFPALFSTAWDKSVTLKNIQSGFRACGIVPYNPDAIPDKAYGPSELTDKPLVQSTVASRPSTSNDESVISENACAADGSDPANTDANLPLLSVEENIVSLEEVVNSGDVAPVFEAVESIVNPREILDISDPSQLLQLLAEGVVTAELLTDAHEMFPPTIGANEIVSTPVNSIDSSIQEAFVPPPMLPGSENKNLKRKHGKSITAHRLLTTEDIVKDKIRLATVKKEKEEKKKERMAIKQEKLDSKNDINAQLKLGLTRQVEERRKRKKVK